jgi:hypothetical protein
LQRLVVYKIIFILLFAITPANAEWNIESEANVFYTDDVSIFSASQRLSHREDPTQPVIDITDVGGDAVIQPKLFIGKQLEPSWGKLKIEVQAEGFIFAEHSEFDHLIMGSQITQNLGEDTLLRLRYHYGPDLFLGLNKEKRTGQERIEEEVVTTRFGVVEIEQEFSESFMFRILGRYGERTYNQLFSQRDTKFWTVGAHAEWEIFSLFELVLGYHYERGLSAGRTLPQFEDDISSVTHYVVAELDMHVSEKTSVKLGFDFEKNIFTSRIINDEHRFADEDVYQGEIEVFHEIYEHWEINAAFLHGLRKFSFEPEFAKVNTARIGIKYLF